jgi:hypothetical protein
VPKEPAARGNAVVQNVLAGTALSVHVAAAIPAARFNLVQNLALLWQI